MKNNSKIKFIFGFAFIILFIILIYYSETIDSYIYRKYIPLEEKDSISDNVLNISNNHGLVYIKLVHNKNIIIQKTVNEKNEISSIINFISKGDSIYKASYSDTLTIIKNNKRLIFIIKKYYENK